MKKNMKKILLAGIGLLLAGVIVLTAVREEEKTQTYDIVFMGDSVIGNHGDSVSVTAVMEKRLGKTVFNGALGGSCMSLVDEVSWESVSGRQWSMVKLAQAMYTGDWTGQLSGVSYSEYYIDMIGQVLDYFYDRIQTLSRIDFEQVDILLIEHGTNDYNSGQLSDNEADPFDVNTYGGALRQTISLLQERFPELQIILVSPIYCEFSDIGNAKCTEMDFGGGVLDAYVEVQKNIAQEYDLEWIDLYHSSGIGPETIDIYTYDKLHLTKEGQQLIGDLVADYLEENVR